MNISVERKIASIAEKLEGVTYLFDNWIFHFHNLV